MKKNNSSNISTHRTLMRLLVIACIAIAPLLAPAGTHVWNPAAGGYWSSPGRWSSGGVPKAGETDLRLIFPPRSSPVPVNSAINDIPGLTVTSIKISGDNYQIGGKNAASFITLAGGVSLLISGQDNRLDKTLKITLAGTNTVTVAGSEFTINGQISGPGGLVKSGDGWLTLGCDDDNLYTGTTRVIGGRLALHRDYSGWYIPIQISGTLIIGGTDPAYSPEVLIGDGVQLAPDIHIELNPNGTLWLFGHTQSCEGLNLTGGYISTGGISPGLLIVNGGISEHYPGTFWATNKATIRDGCFSFTPGNHGYDVEPGTRVVVRAGVGESGGSAGIIKSGAGVLELHGTNTFSGEMQVHAGKLVVMNNYALGSTAGGTTVAVGAQLGLGARIAGEPLVLGNPNASGFDFFYIAAATLFTEAPIQSWGGPITLASDVVVETRTPGSSLTIFGSITGPGGIDKIGDGVLAFTGPSLITATGAVRVLAGEIQLGKVFPRGGAGALAGPLEAGLPGIYNNGHPTVRLLADRQFNNASVATIHLGSRFELEGYTATVGHLTLDGGAVNFNSDGTLAPLGPLSVISSLTNEITSIMYKGILALGAATRTIQFQPGGKLELSHNTSIVDGSGSGSLDNGAVGSLTASGPGRLTTAGSNSFSGPLNVRGGATVEAYYNRTPFGSTNGPTIVEPDGHLLLTGSAALGEPLILQGDNGTGALLISGSNVWSGPVTITSDTTIMGLSGSAGYNTSLDLSGPVSGPAGLRFLTTLTYVSSSSRPRLRFSGSEANTFAGSLIVGTNADLEFGKGFAFASRTAVPGALQINNGGIARWLLGSQTTSLNPVYVETGGLLDLSGKAETLGSIAGGGTLQLGGGNLTVGMNGGSTAFTGPILGTNSSTLFKVGPGTLALAGLNTFIGFTSVAEGTLLVNGEQGNSTTTVQPGAVLGGTGRLGNIFGNGGTISPGVGPGRLRSASVDLSSSSIFRAELSGTNAGINCDQLRLAGTVNLNGATLIATLGFISVPGDQFLLIDNDGTDAVFGTFKDLPEGATITLNDANFRITYQGGDGNDVVLARLSSIGNLKASPSSAKSAKGVIQLTGLAKLRNGTMQLSGTGLPGANYTVQGNFDFSTTNWLNIGTTTANTPDGLIQFIDLDAPNHAMRFYRLVAP